MKKLTVLLIGLMMLTVCPAQASNWPITYVLNGILTGDYLSQNIGHAFSDAAFTFRVTADTADVVALTTFNPDDLYAVGAHPLHSGPALSGRLFIDGVGQFTLLNKLYVSDSQWNNLQPGIFEFGTDLEEKIISVETQFFQTYQMITAVSPLEVALYQTGFVPFAVSESGGTTGELTLVDASSLRFQAEGGVPEPSTFVLLGVGLAGLIAVMRKQRVT